MSAPLPFRPLELRLAPEYRRCGVYVAVGFVVVAAVVVGLNLAEANPTPWASLIAGLAALGAATAALVTAIFRYRIRIDQHGVWRRRVVRWDLWPWEAFEGGKVQYGRYGDQLAYPDKPRRWRTLAASVLGEADRAAFETVVRRYHIPPPPPDVPDELTLKLPMRRTLHLSAAGVRLAGARDPDGEPVPWPDVVRAEVFPTTRDRPDFATLELHLPGRPEPVRLTHRQGAPTWSGAEAEVIALYLRRHLPDERFQVTAHRGPPADLAEADRRLARLDAIGRDLRKTTRVMRHAFVWFGLVLLVGTFEPWNRPNPVNWGPVDWAALAGAVGATVALLGFLGLQFFGIMYVQGRELRRQRADVLRWRAEHAPAAAT